MKRVMRLCGLCAVLLSAVGLYAGTGTVNLLPKNLVIETVKNCRPAWRKAYSAMTPTCKEVVKQSDNNAFLDWVNKVVKNAAKRAKQRAQKKAMNAAKRARLRAKKKAIDAVKKARCAVQMAQKKATSMVNAVQQEEKRKLERAAAAQKTLLDSLLQDPGLYDNCGVYFVRPRQ